MNKKYIFFIILFAVLSINYSDAQDFKPLFNGKDLNGWYTFLKTKGKSNNPDSVFSVNDPITDLLSYDQQ